MLGSIKNKLRGIHIPKRQIIIFVFALMMIGQSVFAQSTIEFDTGELITQSNSWIGTFLPILAIPFGISIALALITLVGGLIVKALRSMGGGK